ncbi:MAG: aspartyl/asparaginyl beta-hydroxylase domain-containing protein [Cyanobacteria bacterium P01_A01_bin.17]
MTDWVRVLVNSPIVKGIINAVPKYSKVGDSVFFTNDQFPWSYELEADWEVIRAELDQVLTYASELPNFQDIMPRQQRLTQDDGWKTFYFHAFGFTAEKNCEQCPETWKLLKQVPGLKTAFFSILAPGKHIPEHYGKHKGIIRYHLALRVPEPRENCWIMVDGHKRYWEEGKSLIFDDTFMHQVRNDTDGYRVVLFVDIARPLRFPLSLVNGLVSQGLRFSPLVQTAKANHQSWEKRFEASKQEEKKPLTPVG